MHLCPRVYKSGSGGEFVFLLYGLPADIRVRWGWLGLTQRTRPGTAQK